MTDFTKQNNIAIYGFAREGVSTLNFLRSHGFSGQIVVIDDKTFENLEDNAKNVFKSDKKIEFLEGSALRNKQNVDFDTLFLTPGTPLERVPNRLWPIVTSQTAIFLEKYAVQTIGITGTKGKSTTSSIIFEILKQAGKDVVLLGNIGLPPLDFFDKIHKDTLVVFELSSHQLSLTKSSPHIAVFLNIFKEHLDYYKDFESYFNAKAKITEFQTKNDFLVINTLNSSPILEKLAKTSRATIKPIVLSTLDEVSTWPTSLEGQFNRLNIAAAWDVARLFNIDEKTTRLAVANFKPLEHRLEKVGFFHGVIFYNDSIATTPESTISALDTFGVQVETLLLGGFDRQLDYEKLADRLDQSQIKNLILFPTTGQRVKNLLQDPSRFNILETDSLEKAVQFAYKNTSPGKIVLLSPAASSFNLFKDYVDRGRQFKEWVVKLGKSG